MLDHPRISEDLHRNMRRSRVLAWLGVSPDVHGSDIRDITYLPTYVRDLGFFSPPCLYEGRKDPPYEYGSGQLWGPKANES